MLTAVDQSLSISQFSILQIGDLQLAFPQNQIASVDLLGDMDTSQSNQLNVGWLNNEKQSWPIFAISSSLSVLPTIPEQRRFCVCFHPAMATQSYCGLLADAVLPYVLSDSSSIEILPDCMFNPHSPIRQFFKNDNKITFICDSNDITRFLNDEERAYGRD